MHGDSHNHANKANDTKILETVEQIRSAEQDYDKVISVAKAKASMLLKVESEKIAEKKRKANSDAVSKKNELIKKGSEKIEADVSAIVLKAKDEAKSVSRKTLDKNFLNKLAKELLSSS